MRKRILKGGISILGIVSFLLFLSVLFLWIQDSFRQGFEGFYSTHPSSSQDSQDQFLEENIFHGFKNGIFVDVGAHDGVSYNNTFYFEQANGWNGINIEANPDIYSLLVKNRPSCINLSCAVANTEGTAEFYKNKGGTEMLSGLVQQYHPLHTERLKRETETSDSSTEIIQVPTKRLASIFDEHMIHHVHYLSIDVEGAEYDVIQSIDFDKVKIDVIGYETNYKDTGSNAILQYLESKGYVLIQENNTSLDTFVIHKESPFYKKTA